MDPLSHYQQDIHQAHVGRHDLIPHLAIHAIKKIPGARQLLQKHFSQATKPVTQIKPPPYNNDGKIQMMHN